MTRKGRARKEKILTKDLMRYGPETDSTIQENFVKCYVQHIQR